jgi:DNA-binding MarR family transcriptional regulator
MNSVRAGLTDSRNTPRFRRDDAPATASGESPVGGDGNVPLSTGDSFTPRELAAWHGLLEVHAHVLRQLDLKMRAAHGLTLSQSEVLIFLDDAPDQRVRMAQLAKGVLLSSSGGTRLVERLETLGYVTRRAAADDRRGLFAELTDAGRHVAMAARATYREGVRATFLDRLRAADQVALSVISTRVSGGHV